MLSAVGGIDLQFCMVFERLQFRRDLRTRLAKVRGANHGLIHAHSAESVNCFCLRCKLNKKAGGM